MRPTEEELILHKVNYNSDSDFTAWARLKQSAWREANNIPIGSYVNIKKETIVCGNYIDRNNAHNLGTNFVSAVTFEVVKSSLKNKEEGAKIEEGRLFENMLSSQPLAFNLFGELSVNLEMATKYFKQLFPDRIKEVTEIIFEHSPGRGDCEYTCDHSAFDVFIRYNSNEGKKGFAGIEVKYSENLKDKPSSHKRRYEELTTKSDYFIENSLELLKEKPIQQIWRDHLLSIATGKDYEEGFFIYLFPKNNKECQEGLDKYLQLFKSYSAQTKTNNEKGTGFYPRYLDDFIVILNNMAKADWSNKLQERYL